MRRIVSLLILLIFISTGCTIYRPLGKTTPVSSLPDFYSHYYDYPAVNLETKILGEETHRAYRLKKIQFALSLPEELTRKDLPAFQEKVEEIAQTDQKTANDLRLLYTNRIDLYLPKKMKPGEKRPVILVSPILGGNMVVDHFAKFYAARGCIAALVYRKKVFWDDEDIYPGQLEKYLRASIIRLRQSVDWLETQPEVDKTRIGAFGVSYGAVLHTVLAAVEPRIRYHVLAMPAAPLADVIMHCPDKAITKLVKHAQEKYGYSRDKIYKDLQISVKTDPIYLAPYAPKSKIQIYIALFDRVVGANRSWRLWKALGKPQVKVMPFGHYGGVVIFPYLQWRSYLSFWWVFK